MSPNNARARTFAKPAAVAIFLVGALTLTSCADDSETETAEGGEVFSLTLGAGVPASAYPSIGTVSEIFAPEVQRRVEDETPHEIKFTEQFGTVAHVGEELGAIAVSQLDIGTLGFTYEPSDMPLQNLAYYVPFSSPDAEIAVAAFRDVHESSREMSEVYEEHNQMPLAFYTVGDYGLGTNFPVESVEDLRGQEIAGVGPNLEWIGPMDAIPVQAPSNEWYSSFQTGVYSGVVSFVEGFNSQSLYEVLTHYTDMAFGAMTLGALTVNLDTWNSLPPEVQEIITEVALEFEKESARVVNEAAAESREVMASEGMTIVEPDDELAIEWATSLSDLPQARATEMDEAGLPGSELIADYIRAQEELGHEFPYDYEIEGQ